MSRPSADDRHLRHPKQWQLFDQFLVTFGITLGVELNVMGLQQNLGGLVAPTACRKMLTSPSPCRNRRGRVAAYTKLLGSE